MADPVITVVHAYGGHVSVGGGGVELLRYVYRPDPDPFESGKPYAHPLRTLAGDTVTDYRPHDHRWHKGLQMTASHLSGHNLWGGNSYVHGRGYLALPERVGSMRHDTFDAVDVTADRVVIAERLTWLDSRGSTLAEERREIAVHDVDPAGGSWALDWTSATTARHARGLRFGSPTTHGRPQAGYTGLFWRGPRSFRDGVVAGPTGQPDMMGRRAPWLAYTGQHDGVDRASTLVFAHAPENEEGPPSHWFVRSDPFAAVNPSLAFHEEFELPPGDTLTRRYRVVVANGAWDAERVERYLKEHPC